MQHILFPSVHSVNMRVAENSEVGSLLILCDVGEEIAYVSVFKICSSLLTIIFKTNTMIVT
jgi:hypothetical protein